MPRLHRPLRIVKAHPRALRGLVAHGQPESLIAPGFKPAPSLDLTWHGGRTLPDLLYRTFYLGGDRWPAADIARIDAALSGAMSDPGLNDILLQYYPGRSSISSGFLGSRTLSDPIGKTFTRDDVNPVLSALLAKGAPGKTAFDRTVICLCLPPGAILTDQAAGGVGKGRRAPTKTRARRRPHDDRDSSLNGLAGYHGSCHLGTKQVYFAISVYSEVAAGKPNGIPFWPAPWKNVVATLYHELNEARTDPDVEESDRTGRTGLLGWYADARGGGEIGDMPLSRTDQLSSVMVEVSLAAGGEAPVQLLWSNRVHGPEGPAQTRVRRRSVRRRTHSGGKTN